MVDLPTLTPNMAEAQANIISIHYTIHLKNGLSNQHLWQLPLRLVHPSERHFCPEGNGGRIGGSMSPKSRTQEDVSINGWFIFGKTHKNG